MNKKETRKCPVTYPPQRRKALNKNDIYGIYAEVCAVSGIKTGVTRKEFDAGETPFVEDEYIIKTIRALIKIGRLKGFDGAAEKMP